MKNLIGYEWKEASDGATIEVVNPATQELIDTVPNVTEEDVDEAVKIALIEQKKWEKVSIYERAEKLAQSLFNNEFKNLTKQDISDLFDEQDIKEVESNVGIVDMLVKVGAASSKREAREFTQSGAVSINGEKVTDVTTTITDDMFIDETYIIIKRGKKNYYVGRK